MLRLGQLSHDLAITAFYHTISHQERKFSVLKQSMRECEKTVKMYDQWNKTVEAYDQVQKDSWKRRIDWTRNLSKKTSKSLQAKSATQQSQKRNCEQDQDKNAQRDTWTSTNILHLLNETHLQRDRNEMILQQQYTCTLGELNMDIKQMTNS